MGVNVLNEYKQHNEFLIEQVKEKNKENLKLRQKVGRYETALKFGVKYLQNSDIRQIQLVRNALNEALEDNE